MSNIKTLSFAVNDVVGNFQTPLYHAVKEYAKKRHCNIICVEGRVLNGSVFSERNHNVIYQLLDNTRHDGILLSSGTIFVDYSAEDNQHVHEYVKHLSNAPKACIFKEIDGQTSFIIDNKHGFREVIKHLIQEHDCRKILHISGPKDNVEAQERLQAYTEELEKHGIDFDSRLILTGDFRRNCVPGLLADFFATGLSFDAIACASDDMAIEALSFLQKKHPHYYKVIPVTGFDDTPDCELSDPQLTSVASPIKSIIASAMDYLLDKKYLNSPPKTHKLETELVVRESCGCSTKTQVSEQSDRRIYPFAYVVQESILSFDRQEFFDLLTEALPHLYIRSCYVSLYKSPQLDSENFVMPDKAELIYAYHEQKRIYLKDNLQFDTRDLVPDDFFDIGKSRVLLLKPLFFKKENYGFVLFDATYAREVDLESIHGHICNCLKGALLSEQRDNVEKQLKQAIAKANELNRRLENQAITDELTGLDNRRGLWKQIYSWIDNSSGLIDMTIFFMDLDGLKLINDCYGHAEGDFAIKSLAKALKACFSPSEIIARVSGDEFIVIADKLDNQYIHKIIKNIDIKLKRYIRVYKKPYDIGFSYGCERYQGFEKPDFNKLIDIADTKLYKKKKQKKRHVINEK